MQAFSWTEHYLFNMYQVMDKTRCEPFKGEKRDSSTSEYEVKYKRSTEGVQGEYRKVQEEYRGSTGGVQVQYE